MPDRPTRLLVASTNPGKIREILRVLDGLGLAIRTLSEHPSVPEPEETGLTFAANAELKARYYAAATAWPAAVSRAVGGLGGFAP